MTEFTPDLDWFKKQKQRSRQAVRDFVRGAAEADLRMMLGTFETLAYGDWDGGGWKHAMRAVSRLGSVPEATKSFFLQVFMDKGDSIRQECDDLALLSGLRVLLPRYEGTGMQLYRGDSFLNRKHRTYGASWSSDIEVAQGFADGWFHQCSKGGSVLLEAYAPPEAIICAPHLIDDRYGEQEYVVDRRYLKRVAVLERFPEKKP